MPDKLAKRHASLQALKDAIETRSLIFQNIQGVNCARIRVYRATCEDSFETVIFGILRRNEGAFRHIHSLAMRAKLLGFRFRLEDEILHALRLEDQI